MKFEYYNFQNIYIITTYRCNWSCPFCLFRFKKEKEAPIKDIIDKLEYAINNSNRKIYIKITGGEPFLKPKLLNAIIDITNRYANKIYKIGIGSNGSICLPYHFNNIINTTHIFLSRHNLDDNLPTPNLLSKNVKNNNNIDFRINCNLIKNGIDNLDKIKEYIYKKLETIGINHFCFRELSRIDIDSNSMYPKEIYDYNNYFEYNHIALMPIFKELKKDKDFEYSRLTGNYYDKNFWYWFYVNGHNNKPVSIKFRSINEKKLLEYNKNINPNNIDEYVIHPDGTLTGCWDKDIKLIKKGD